MEYPMQPPPPRRRPETGSHHPQPPPPPQKCPRCDSSNTKFCYYNNYSLAQPRYFCKACRRYWTHGGTLRNVPVGGGCRRARHRRTTTTATSGVSRPPAVAEIPPLPDLPVRTGVTILPPMGSGAGSFLSGGSFLSSLTGGMNPAVAAGGGGQYDSASMGLFQNLQSLQPPSSDQMFPTQQGLNFNPGRAGMSPWGHIFMRGSSSAVPSSSFWSRAAGASDNQTGSNPFHPNQWPDSNSG